VWDLESAERNDAPGTGGAVRAVAFVPGERRLAVARKERVDILDGDSLETLLVLPAPGLTATAAAFADDGTLVLSGDGSALGLFRSARPEQGEASYAASRRASGLVDMRVSLATPFEDVAKGLAARHDIPEQARQEALKLARLLGQNPSLMNSEALRTALRTDASPEEYELALRRVETARRVLGKESQGLLMTLSMAQYRTGRHAEALRTLDRLAELRAPADPPPAVDLALRAMAERALGRREDARRSYERLEEAARQRPELDDDGFLIEARTVFGVSGR
jgi:tetratricopeptide (TPR) repeat protein